MNIEEKSKVIQTPNSIESIVENKKEKSVLLQKTLEDGRTSIKQSYLNKETGKEIIKEYVF